jgi:UDP-2,4-diacetamido-2,4,6-trideoxy-beta-L-altropyranose hydrolase
MDVQGATRAGDAALICAAFRVDASLEIGTGHVMRSLTLADALREQGVQCRFICREHDGNLIGEIRRQGFIVHALPLAVTAGEYDETSPHAAWLGVNWATDAEQTLTVLSGAIVDWLIVDHYVLDARWEKQLRAACRHVMAIDDLADRRHDCDVLLDQNLNRRAADYAALVSRDCNVLVGPKYALLRPEFAALRNYSLARRENSGLEHLLVSMGGVDKHNVTGRVLEALNDCALSAACRITVVMGAQAPWIAEVRAQAAGMRSTEVLIDVPNMAELMADSDLAIGAAGTSAWERCCLGLPTLMIVLAANQSAGAQALNKSGAALLLEDREQLAIELQVGTRTLMQPKGLQRMQEACRLVTDGKGVMRAVEIIAHAN